MTTNSEQLRQWDAENDAAIAELEAKEARLASELGEVRHELAKRKEAK